jgi:hypothetical protein
MAELESKFSKSIGRNPLFDWHVTLRLLRSNQRASLSSIWSRDPIDAGRAAMWDFRLRSGEWAKATATLEPIRPNDEGG